MFFIFIYLFIYLFLLISLKVTYIFFFVIYWTTKHLSTYLLKQQNGIT